MSERQRQLMLEMLAMAQEHVAKKRTTERDGVLALQLMIHLLKVLTADE